MPERSNEKIEKPVQSINHDAAVSLSQYATDLMKATKSSENPLAPHSFSGLPPVSQEQVNVPGMKPNNLIDDKSMKVDHDLLETIKATQELEELLRYSIRSLAWNRILKS